MANEQNLKKFGSEREPREAGRKGGIASVKARRRKRSMREAAKLLLDMPVANESVARQIQELGFDEKDITNQIAIMVSMFKESMAGSVQAAVFLRDTSGDKQESIQAREEFEYKKERDAGISQEIEDMDGIEEEIYGSKKESGKDKEIKPETRKDDTV